MIEVTNLHKSFHGQAVLKGLSLTIADGELLVIIGRSGGGKSVFLKHLIGLFRPDSGHILINTVDLPTLRGQALVNGLVSLGNRWQTLTNRR